MERIRTEIFVEAEGMQKFGCLGAKWIIKLKPTAKGLNIRLDQFYTFLNY